MLYSIKFSKSVRYRFLLLLSAREVDTCDKVQLPPSFRFLRRTRKETAWGGGGGGVISKTSLLYRLSPICSLASEDIKQKERRKKGPGGGDRGGGRGKTKKQNIERERQNQHTEKQNTRGGGGGVLDQRSINRTRSPHRHWGEGGGGRQKDF